MMHVVYWSLIIPLHVALSDTGPHDQEVRDTSAWVDPSGSAMMRKVHRVANTVSASDEQDLVRVTVGVDSSGSTTMRKTHHMANDVAAPDEQELEIAAVGVETSGSTVMRKVHRAAIGAAVNAHSSGLMDEYTEAAEPTPAEVVDDGQTQDGPILSDEEKATTKYIEGVPIYNYHMAYEGGMNPSLLQLAEQKRWLLTFPDHFTDRQIKRFCKRSGNAKCEMLGHPSSGGISFAEFTATEAELQAALMKHHTLKPQFMEPEMQVRAIPEMDVHENHRHLSSLVDVGNVPWGLDRIDDKVGLDGSYNAPGRQGAGAHVYVADTGININHPDFEGRASYSHECHSGSVQVCSAFSSNCGDDRHGHGTHCAGTVGGKRYGVAKKAKLYSAKVLTDQGGGSNLGTIASLDWVLTSGHKPSVWSASLGGIGRDRAEENAIEKATRGGIVVVVAAGNEGEDACKYSPAFSSHAITVGASQRGDGRASNSIWSSNWGKCVNIFAPGMAIESASHLGGSVSLSGTSMACPHVAGGAALLLADGTSASGVRNALLSSASKGHLTNLRGSPNQLLYTGRGNNPSPSPSPSPTPSSPSPSPTPSSPSPSSGEGQAKTKDKGCLCQTRWEVEGEPPCEKSCCNPGGSMKADWCPVVDQACQGEFWGYCEYGSTPTAPPPEPPTAPPVKPTRPPPRSGEVQPVYEFWNEKNKDHTYHFGDAAPGETKNSVAFYAYTPKG